MQNAEFFTNHLYNSIQDQYELSDTEMRKLVEFVEEMYDHDRIRGVKVFLKNRGDKNLERMMQEVIGRELSTAMTGDIVVNDTGPLSMPIGAPLTL